MPDLKLDDLNKMAEDVGKVGQEYDGALGELAKGASAALLALSGVVTDMRKGRGAAPDGADKCDACGSAMTGGKCAKCGDGGGAGAGAGAADDDEPMPGFEDMRMGRGAGTGDGGGAGTGAADEAIDATLLVRDLWRLAKAQDRKIEALAREVAGLRKELADSTAATAGVLAPLTKGVVVIGQSLADMPAATVRGSLRPGETRVGLARHGSGGGAAGVSRLPLAKLAKALDRRVISETDLRFYKQHGNFGLDDSAESDLVKRIEALL